MDRDQERTPTNETPSEERRAPSDSGEDRSPNLTEIDPDEANKSGVYDTAGDREDHT